MRPDYYEMNWFAERQRAFMEAIQPILEIKSRIYAITIPQMTIYADGRSEVEYNFAPGLQRILDQCDEHIAYLKEQAYKDCPFPQYRMEHKLGDH